MLCYGTPAIGFIEQDLDSRYEEWNRTYVCAECYEEIYKPFGEELIRI